MNLSAKQIFNKVLINTKLFPVNFKLLFISIAYEKLDYQLRCLDKSILPLSLTLDIGYYAKTNECTWLRARLAYASEIPLELEQPNLDKYLPIKKELDSIKYRLSALFTNITNNKSRDVTGSLFDFNEYVNFATFFGNSKTTDEIVVSSYLDYLLGKANGDKITIPVFDGENEKDLTYTRKYQDKSVRYTLEFDGEFIEEVKVSYSGKDNSNPSGITHKFGNMEKRTMIYRDLIRIFSI